jgi:hypothetical protein
LLDEGHFEQSELRSDFTPASSGGYHLFDGRDDLVSGRGLELTNATCAPDGAVSNRKHWYVAGKTNWLPQ